MATTEPYCRAMSWGISGFGLARENRNGPSAIFATCSAVRRPADTPMKASASTRASVMVPCSPRGLVSSAMVDLTSLRGSRPSWMMPRESTTTMSLTPADSSIRVVATPAAPAPEMTTFRSSRRRPVSLQALRRPAVMTIAVPCWSSWKTGMSSLSSRRRSTSKQRGAEMSSRLMPPKEGARRAMVSTSSSGSVVSRTMGTALSPAKRPNSWALPSMTGRAARGPMSPRPRTAVPSEMTATLLPVQV